MKSTRKTRYVIPLSFLISASSLFAQATWTGAGTSGTPAQWSAQSNWSVGTAPTSSTTTGVLTFLNTSANSFSNNDLTGLTVGGINIPATDGAVAPAVPLAIKDNTIGGNQINLAGTFTVATGNWQTVNLAMALNGNRTFAISNGKTFLNGVISDGTTVGEITKTVGGELVLSAANTLSGVSTSTGNERLLFSGAGSGTVTLQNTAALGATGGVVRFSGGGSGNLQINSDSAINSYVLASGTGNGGTVTLARQTAGAGYTQDFSIANLSSVTLTINQTATNVTSGTMRANIGQVQMTAGNDNNAVTLAGTAAITVGSASITSTGISKRLQLDGTSNANSIGLISNTSNGTTGSPVVNLIKANTSTWTLTSANTYTGTTTISGGTLAMGVSNTFADSSNFVMNGGTLAVSTFSDTVGTLSLLPGTSTITLGSGGTFAFADSSALSSSWAGTLSISGTFLDGSSIRFGTNGLGLTSTQLALININGFAAAINGSGYLTVSAIPEPATYAALAGLGILGFVAYRRRRA